MPDYTAPDATHCPICGQTNQCAMEVEKETGVKQQPCWCTQVDFNAELLKKVPGPSRGKACICEACARGTDAGSSPA